MPLGTLRNQLLFPSGAELDGGNGEGEDGAAGGAKGEAEMMPLLGGEPRLPACFPLIHCAWEVKQ